MKDENNFKLIYKLYLFWISNIVAHIRFKYWFYIISNTEIAVYNNNNNTIVMIIIIIISAHINNNQITKFNIHIKEKQKIEYLT